MLSPALETGQRFPTWPPRGSNDLGFDDDTCQFDSRVADANKRFNTSAIATQEVELMVNGCRVLLTFTVDCHSGFTQNGEEMNDVDGFRIVARMSKVRRTI